MRLPPGEGPFPGVVLVHGSGDSDRSNPWTSAWAAALVERGVAVLHPDKRGCGESGGDWRSATLSDLAGDAAAAVDALRAQAGVDPRRVGVFGFSQGGQVVAEVAARTEGPAFAIDLSGATAPIDQQIADEVALMAERAGLSLAARERVLRANALALDHALRGTGWPEYLATLHELDEGPWGQSDIVTGFPRDPDDPAWAHLRAIAGYDPMPYWTRAKIPVLFVFGGRDERIRVDRSMERIRRELGDADRNVTVLLFQPNGHALYRDDTADFIARWIRDGGAP